jgi:uncharacterized membrane protein
MRCSRRIAFIAALVACAGLADSGYLTTKHLQGTFIRCGGDCSAVLGSRYAEGIAGIPLAGFGAMAYGIVIVSTILVACGFAIGRKIFAVMATIMALSSIWLIYLQAFVIHAFCKYCLASAAFCFTLVALVVIDRVFCRPSAAESPTDR